MFLLVNQVSFVYALELGSATTVALILGTTPIFAALVSSLVGLERLTGRFWLATVIGFAGVALVALGSGGNLSSDLGGDLLAILLAISWACYSVTIAPLMRRYSPYRISAVVLLVMCVPFVALSSPQIAGQDYASLSWVVWLGLAFAIAGPLALTNVLWFTAIGRVGPSRATLFANIQPFVAAIFAGLILSEHLHPLQVVGGFTILARDRPRATLAAGRRRGRNAAGRVEHSRARASRHPARGVPVHPRPRARGLRRADGRALLRRARPDDRRHRAAADRLRRRRADELLVDRHRVHARADGHRARVREARRRARAAGTAARRDRDLPRRLGAVRGGADDAAARRVPGACRASAPAGSSPSRSQRSAGSCRRASAAGTSA